MKLWTVLKIAAAPVVGIIMMVLPVTAVVTAVTKPEILETQTPGTAIFTVDEAGDYTVWRRTVGTIDDEFRVEDEKLPPGLSLSIRRTDDGTTVPITSSGNHTQTVNGQSKVALVNAHLTPGSYELVSATAPEDRMTLVISENIGSLGGFFTGLFMGVVGFALFFGGCIYALVVIIREAVKKPAQRPGQ